MFALVGKTIDTTILIFDGNPSLYMEYWCKIINYWLVGLSVGNKSNIQNI